MEFNILQNWYSKLNPPFKLTPVDGTCFERGVYSGREGIYSGRVARGSTHHCAIAPRALSRHIVDFLESRRMETVPMSTEVILRPTLD